MLAILSGCIAIMVPLWCVVCLLWLLSVWMGGVDFLVLSGLLICCLCWWFWLEFCCLVLFTGLFTLCGFAFDVVCVGFGYFCCGLMGGLLMDIVVS